MQNLIEQARAFAIEAHRQINHRRKYSAQPYDVHLKAVADLVASVTANPQMLAAAWLHDTVEDTAVTLDQVRDNFGAEVAALVADLTDVSRPSDGNRAARKAIDREHTARASLQAKTIKLADLIDNLRDIVPADPNFAPLFLVEARGLLAVLQDGDARLWTLAEHEIEAGEQRLRKLKADTPLPFASNPTLDRARTLRLFTEAIRARDLAEPLRWFDATRPAREVREWLEADGASVVGIMAGGRPQGFCVVADLGEKLCGDYLRPSIPR